MDWPGRGILGGAEKAVDAPAPGSALDSARKGDVIKAAPPVSPPRHWVLAGLLDRRKGMTAACRHGCPWWESCPQCAVDATPMPDRRRIDFSPPLICMSGTFEMWCPTCARPAASFSLEPDGWHHTACGAILA